MAEEKKNRQRPEEPPAGSQSVRSSCEAGNDRGAKGLEESGWPMNRNNEPSKTTPATVAAATPSQQAGEAPARRDPWWWVERGVWTKAMLSRLTSRESVRPVWFRWWDIGPLVLSVYLARPANPLLVRRPQEELALG